MGIVLTVAAAGGLAVVGSCLVHAVALWRADRLRPQLEGHCSDHVDEPPLPLRTRLGSFVAECGLTVGLLPLGIGGPHTISGGADRSHPSVLIVTPRWCRGLAWPWVWALRQSGTMVAVAVGDRLVTATCAAIASGIRALHAAGGGERIDLVALASAGFAARIYASEPGTPVRRLVTVATPHRGTLAWWPLGGREIRPDGALVQQASTGGGGRAEVACIVVYSGDDPALLPAANAYLHGALSIEIRGLGHVSTCVAPRVIRLVQDALADTPPLELPCTA